MPSEMQCGHYVSRACLPLRYDEINCHCQDYACNISKNGNIIEYRERLVKDYGEQVVLDLERRRHDTVKLTPEWYHRMIDHYRAKLTAFQARN